MGSKIINIRHTRIKREVVITQVRPDDYNPTGLIVEFTHSIPTNYFIESDFIKYGLYIDKKFREEFSDQFVKIQVENLNVVQLLEIYAHPHAGFQFIMARQSPGNKIRVRFRGKDPAKTDIKNHYVYWDNKTGTYLTKKAGIIDPTDATVSGNVFKEGAFY